MFLEKIKILQVDLVSSCNAYCACCFRQDIVGNPNEKYPKNKHLDLALFKKLLLSEELKHLESIVFCGNYGDALASPKIVEFIDAIDAQFENLSIIIHTNGSLGSKDLWGQLALRLRKPWRHIKFAIDGLSDTNHIYRRGVNWDILMQNAQQFISAGGEAHWKYVIFEHNKHQINSAQKLASELGFKNFKCENNFSPEKEPFYSLESRPLFSSVGTFDHQPDFSNVINELNSNKRQINCFAKKDYNLYLDFEGNIWPCCWMAGWKYADQNFYREKNTAYFTANNLDDALSLYKYSLKEILDNQWFAKNLEKSWVSFDAEKTHLVCISQCGKCE